MPQGVNPPRGAVQSGTVTILQSGSTTYNNANNMITNGGTNYYLCVQRGATSDSVEWFYATAAEAGAKKNPYCTLTSTTFNVMHGGTYDQTAKTYAYSGFTYEIRLEFVSGALWASAIKV